MFKKQNETKYTSPSESMTVKIEIPDFSTKMTGGQYLMIKSSTFRIRGKDLRIQVYPNNRNSKNIGVYLHNNSKDTVTATFSVKNEKQGSAQTVFKKRKIKAVEGWGRSYWSHTEYRWFIKSDDDVFRLEFEVTLYFTEDMEIKEKRYLLSFFY